MSYPGATNPRARLPRNRRSPCAIARTLDVIRDRWTLLIARDLSLGKRRFAEFLDSPEGVAPNVLTERLRRLGKAGIVARQRYSEHPPRHEYLPTPKGADLRLALQAILDWGLSHIPGTELFAPIRQPAIQ